MHRRALLAAPALLALRPAAAQQDWPARPIRFLVPYPPGGPTDILGRVAAQRLGQDLPQPVVVENRGGAAGTIGSEIIARAAPDGYNFLVNASAHVIVPHMMRLPFNALDDFAPVTCIAAVPLILVLPTSSPINSVADLIAHARANPGQLSYASSSSGGSTHLAAEQFKQLTGTDMTHVPYRGSGQALPDLIAGNVQLMFDSLASSADLVRQGRLKAIAVTTAQRLPGFPNLPTIAEAGVPGYEMTTWYGIWAPARTPEAILARVQQSLAAGLRAGEAAERLAALGADAVAQPPAQYAAFCRAEYEKYGRVVRDGNIRAD